jgi:hypothetical protein
MLYQKPGAVYRDLHEITNLSPAAITIIILGRADACPNCVRHTAGLSGVNLMI